MAMDTTSLAKSALIGELEQLRDAVQKLAAPLGGWKEPPLTHKYRLLANPPRVNNKGGKQWLVDCAWCPRALALVDCLEASGDHVTEAQRLWLRRFDRSRLISQSLVAKHPALAQPLSPAELERIKLLQELSEHAVEAWLDELEGALRASLEQRCAAEPAALQYLRALSVVRLRMLREADIPPDESAARLASLRGANVVNLYMARHNWNEWGHENKGYIISRRVPCAGCNILHDPEECGKGFACIVNISPEEVFRTVMEFV